MKPSLRYTGLLLVTALGCSAPHGASGTDAGPSDHGGSTTPNHCGTADVDCTKLPHVDPNTVRCVNGVCDLTDACLGSALHCSSDPNDGCEADIVDPMTCGSCFTQCDSSAPLCLPVFPT